jgi:hypothetical protein
MSLDSEIIVVSGLPRSGTSLMMQMLHRGGLPVVTDEVRSADTDNPRGYFEFERVKKTREDPSWLTAARGKVVKMVSSLLYDLPPTERYRIVFMERELDEVLESQEKMLRRLNRPAAPADSMRKSFNIHLERLSRWLPRQRHMQILGVSYNRVLSDAEAEVRRVAEFLDGRPSTEQMLEAIDPDLYRNRRTTDSFEQP